MAVVPPISVPAIVIHGSEDGATLPETSAGKERFFTAGYERRLVQAGHFVQREDPASVLAAVLELAQI